METKIYQVHDQFYSVPGSEAELLLTDQEYRDGWILYQKTIALPETLERIGLDHLMR